MCAVDMCGNSHRLHLNSKPRLPHRIQRLLSVEVQTQSPFQSIFDCRCACQSSDLEGNRHSHVIRPGDSLTWQTRSESLQEQLSSPKRQNHQGMSGKDEESYTAWCVLREISSYPFCLINLLVLPVFSHVNGMTLVLVGPPLWSRLKYRITIE